MNYLVIFWFTTLKNEMKTHVSIYAVLKLRVKRGFSTKKKKFI